MANKVDQSWASWASSWIPEPPPEAILFRRAFLCLVLPYLAGWVPHRFLGAKASGVCSSATLTLVGGIAAEHLQTKESVPSRQTDHGGPLPPPPPPPNQPTPPQSPRRPPRQQPLTIEQIKQLRDFDQIRDALARLDDTNGDAKLLRESVETYQGIEIELEQIRIRSKSESTVDKSIIADELKKLEALTDELTAWHDQATKLFGNWITDCYYELHEEVIVEKSRLSELERQKAINQDEDFLEKLELIYKIHKVDDDGNCMYLAVAAAAKQGQSMIELRGLVADELTNRFNHWKDDIETMLVTIRHDIEKQKNPKYNGDRAVYPPSLVEKLNGDEAATAYIDAVRDCHNKFSGAGVMWGDELQREILKKLHEETHNWKVFSATYPDDIDPPKDNGKPSILLVFTPGGKHYRWATPREG